MALTPEQLNDPNRFEQWWAFKALPKIQQFAPFFVLNHLNELKQSAQEEWNDAINYLPPQSKLIEG